MPRRAVPSGELIAQYARVLVPLGAAVAMRRKAKRLTQRELAEKAGVERGYLSTLERGHRNPTLVSLHRIAISLDWNLVDLFREAGLGRPPRTRPADPDP